jgi:hypothetical protein
MRVVTLVNHDSTILPQEVKCVRVTIQHGRVVVAGTIRGAASTPEQMGLPPIRIVFDYGRKAVHGSMRNDRTRHVTPSLVASRWLGTIEDRGIGYDAISLKAGTLIKLRHVPWVPPLTWEDATLRLGGRLA